MIFITPATLVMTVVILALVLVVFQSAVTDIAEKESEIKKITGISERLASVVLVAGKPEISLDSCATDTQRAVFDYKFTVSGMEAFYQGLQGETKDAEMSVFVTMDFRNIVARDKDRRLFTLKKGETKAFDALNFEIRSGEAPYILKPDDPAFLGTIGVKQPVVINNYKVTPFKQFRYGPDINPLATCYTDFFIECKEDSKKLSLTSCKDGTSKCNDYVVVCGNRVELTLSGYASGTALTCGSRRMEVVINTPAEPEKKPSGWEYADSASVEFWKKEAAEPKESPCWQQGFTEGCRDRFLGAYLFNLSAERYKVEGCLFAGGGG